MTRVADRLTAPLTVVSFRNSPSSRALPWDLRRGRGDLSAAVLVEGEPDPEGVPELIEEARSSGLLVALVSDRDTGIRLGSDDILIWTDSVRNVHAVPEELSMQLPSTMALDSVKYHGLIFDICEMYRPDLVVLDIEAENEDLLLEIAAHWTSPEVLISCRVVLFSIAENSDRRGWFAMAGNGINGRIPMGVTVSGLFSTIRLLAGLDWIARLPESVPALAVLEDPVRIWRR